MLTLLLSTIFNFSFLSVNIKFNIIYHRGSFSGAKPLPLVTLNTIKSIKNSFTENEISFESKLFCYYQSNCLTLVKNTSVFNLSLIQIIKTLYSKIFHIFLALFRFDS